MSTIDSDQDVHAPLQTGNSSHDAQVTIQTGNPDQDVQATLRTILDIMARSPEDLAHIRSGLRANPPDHDVANLLPVSTPATLELLDMVVERLGDVTDTANRPVMQEAAPTSPNPLQLDKSSEQTVNQLGDIIMRSFAYINRSFFFSLAMSVILFLVGLIFLGGAAVRSVLETTVSTTTLTLAGIGIADFVLLFYRRPWQDIARNLANTHQSTITMLSYLAGVSIVRSDRKESLRLLQQLTHNSLNWLRATERDLQQDGAPAPTVPSPPMPPQP